jgi:hypothetical protein
MTSPFARPLLLGVFIMLLLASANKASAEPYLAVFTGLKCTQCHVNPTGGGLRTQFGALYSQYQLPMNHLDTGGENWTGDVGKFLRVGADLRFQWSVTHEPNTKTVDGFSMEQTRVYLEGNVIPERLIVYIDEQVAPGGALNREAYGLYWSSAHDWYVKAGQMYLPFGFRLQDQTAFVQQVSGINMTTPDQGLEFGWLGGPWDVQANVSNGTAGGPSTGQGKQYTLQASFVQPLWRLGVAASDNDAAGGHREIFGVFAGLHTGIIAWLAEADMVQSKPPVPLIPGASITRSGAFLVEANVQPLRGNNIKLTFEYLDPNADVHNNGQNRWSLLYELTPIQFVQLRAGVRRYQGIPQSSLQNQVLSFLELHAFF